MGRAESFLLLLLLAVEAPAFAAPPLNSTVVVRVFNYAGVPDEQLAEGRRTAADVFTRVGIAIRWIDCRVPLGETGAACNEPLDVGRELMLRLVDAVSPERRDLARGLALGTSMLDRENREGVLMTVDLRPMHRIGRETATAVETLLGRAIAHEIGHLLLGTAEHTREGLMRALWSRDELRGIKPAHWQFSPSEGAQMRQGLAQRQQATN